MPGVTGYAALGRNSLESKATLLVELAQEEAPSCGGVQPQPEGRAGARA